jgi:CRP/FNR family cyclic AMP-dependent transcriptional regulator
MENLELIAPTRVRVPKRRSSQPMPGDWVAALSTFRLFTGVSRRRLRKLVRRATRTVFAPGETIISAVEYGNRLYVILSGTVEVSSRPAARTLRAGDYFGELSLIDGRPRLTTVVALTDVELIELPSRSVLKLARTHSAFTLTIFKDLTPRLGRLETRGAG